ncbi:hypothetical protein Dda_8634 [Drechslerella dactyloides]|uniref:F-box domain-containing protein n=1 Tax=Drechslerella dactyloides TaxID=74499 RepID=A0AAD6IUN9_DREDA|nr:hypothetical protein Dda_8634 [Drechslerella dactyloides]
MAQVYEEMRTPHARRPDTLAPEPRTVPGYELEVSDYELDEREFNNDSASDCPRHQGSGSESEYDDDVQERSAEDFAQEEQERSHRQSQRSENRNSNSSSKKEEQEQQTAKVVEEEEDEEEGPRLVGQDKWMYEHEKRMLQQEQRMLAHEQRILAQEQRMFDHEAKMLQQELWINEQRQKLFEDEERIVDLGDRLREEEERMAERHEAINERVRVLERRISELEQQIAGLKQVRIEVKERNRLTILNLPVEIQAGILEHLPEQYHLYCFQVFPPWREMMVLRDSQPQRYHVSERNYCPRMHNLGADSGWRLVVQDGRLESVTYVVDLRSGIEKVEKKEERSLMRRHSDDRKLATVNLMKSAVLEDPLFLDQPAYPDKEVVAIDGLSFQVGADENGYEALFMQMARDDEQKDVAFTFPFEEHPELKGMQIIEFLDWVAAWVGQIEVLKKYRRITMGLSICDLVGMGFLMLFHDLA